MKYFITGATGFIGSRLALRLAEEGHTVHCLVRSPGSRSLTEHANIHWIEGGLDDIEPMTTGMEGCHGAFHMAAWAKPWSDDKSLPRRINVEGTQNVLNAALAAGVKRLVFTSSGAVIGPSLPGQLASESTVRTVPFFNDYESSKTEAEELVRSFAGKGIETVTVNPTRVYGPGPLNASNSVTRMLQLYDRGKWRIIPGSGIKSGNYVFIDDVVDGHILAMERGKNGERYILGGENISYKGLFRLFSLITGKRRLLVPLPVGVMIAASWLLVIQSHVTGIEPMITPPWVRRYLADWNLSSEKAVSALGYKVTPLAQGFGLTYKWLKAKGI